MVVIKTPLPPPPTCSLANLDLIPAPSPRPLGLSSPFKPYSATAVRPGGTWIISGASVPSAGPTLFDISLATLVVFNAADYATTLKALQYPGVQESNAMMKSIVKDPYAFAAVKIGFTALTCYSLKSLYKKNKPLAWAISIAANLAYSYVVSNNLRIIRQCRAR